MSPAANPEATACRNCGQPVQAAAPTCMWCGVAQGATATQFVMAPSGAGGGTATATAVRPAPTAGAPAQVAAATAATTSAPAAPGYNRNAGRVALGPAFRGFAATTGARLAAFSVDVAVVAAVAAIAMVVRSSLAIGLIVALEGAVFMWVLEARTGLTAGNALLRIRTSKDDAPFSPGIGRTFVRHAITAIGGLVGAVGAWAVVASSAWDSSGQGKGWADRAARTVTVGLAPRERKAAAPAAAAPLSRAPSVYSVNQPAVTVAASGLAAPQVASTREGMSSSLEHSQSVSYTGTAAAGSAEAMIVNQEPEPAAPSKPAAIAPAPGTVADAPTRGTMLIVFDTGQRETLTIPVMANLGRKPSATEPDDQLISVKDPEGTVSKTHLRLEHSRNRTWVTEQGSTNGSDILEDDGDVIQLVAQQRTEVPDGSRVRLGNRTFTVSVFMDDAAQSEEERS